MRKGLWEKRCGSTAPDIEQKGGREEGEGQMTQSTGDYISNCGGKGVTQPHRREAGTQPQQMGSDRESHLAMRPSRAADKIITGYQPTNTKITPCTVAATPSRIQHEGKGLPRQFLDNGQGECNKEHGAGKRQMDWGTPTRGTPLIGAQQPACVRKGSTPIPSWRYH